MDLYDCNIKMLMFLDQKEIERTRKINRKFNNLIIKYTELITKNIIINKYKYKILENNNNNNNNNNKIVVYLFIEQLIVYHLIIHYIKIINIQIS